MVGKQRQSTVENASVADDHKQLPGPTLHSNIHKAFGLADGGGLPLSFFPTATSSLSLFLFVCYTMCKFRQLQLGLD